MEKHTWKGSRFRTIRHNPGSHEGTVLKLINQHLSNKWLRTSTYNSPWIQTPSNVQERGGLAAVGRRAANVKQAKGQARPPTVLPSAKAATNVESLNDVEADRSKTDAKKGGWQMRLWRHPQTFSDDPTRHDVEARHSTSGPRLPRLPKEAVRRVPE